jgi:predicted metalloprotease with PDZ domain
VRLPSPSVCGYKRIQPLVFLAVVFASANASAAVTMRAEIDARDLAKSLLHAKISMPVSPGSVELWYPKWVPGVHGPVGPVRNIGEFKVTSADGKPIKWSRESHETSRFVCEVPAGVREIAIELDYICNQPTENTNGVDSYGTPTLGVINWNTCLVYPGGLPVRDITVDLTLILPDSWKYATALKTASHDANHVTFAPRDFESIVDSPLICGSHMTTIPLDKQTFKPAFLHVVGPDSAATEIKPELIQGYTRLFAEAGALFGGAPFETYHFLVVCSDDIPNIGLEHLESSLNAVDAKALADDDKIASWSGYLLPHEMAHAWCGKYRRPDHMTKPDYHTPLGLNMLWVYEGLDQHLGEVLCVRAGIWNLEDTRARHAFDISISRNTVGREWRSLEDTAVVAWELRARSRFWNTMRRAQDYYREGALLWLEIDAIIRTQSAGQKSLDDFCRNFFAVDPAKLPIAPFTLDELCASLNGVLEHDWKSFFTQRVSDVQAAYPLDFVESLGYHLEYTPKLPAYHKIEEKVGKYINALDSLGVSIGEDGYLRSTYTPGMPLANAGLSPRSKIAGVNGRTFSSDRMREAIRESVQKGGLELLVFDAEAYRTVQVPYRDGERYLSLVRDKDKPDLLESIYAPRTK